MHHDVVMAQLGRGLREKLLEMCRQFFRHVPSGREGIVKQRNADASRTHEGSTGQPATSVCRPFGNSRFLIVNRRTHMAPQGIKTRALEAECLATA